MSKIPIDRNIILLTDDDPQKRRSAAEALMRKMNRGAVKPLLKQLEKEKDLNVRRAIVLSLAFIGGDEVLPVLINI